MIRFLIIPIILFYAGNIQSQVEYNSKLSEYNVGNGNSQYEWIDRNIIIYPGKIVIKSNGKEATDYQTWLISNIEQSQFNKFSLTLYYTHLQSSIELMENPSVFTLYKDPEGRVQLIELQFPIITEDSNKFETHRIHIN
ncbi:hypothetical protein [uncultured Christiangramia sp.]|uniref:hypothetical protein n=1 Tax=uncultured Christiangramia sp. TaxID=503836 RepID=UPI00263448C3|nr:hypothetical protein [uncultured Christiangramia sp.]